MLAELLGVGVEEATTPVSITESARHIASPLPSAGPNSGSSSASWWTSAPARAATSAVPSAEPASTTSTCVDDPALAQARAAYSTIGPDRRRASRAPARTTVTVSVCASRAIRSGGVVARGGRCGCRTTALRRASCIGSTMASRGRGPPRSSRGSALLDAGRADERLVRRGPATGPGARATEPLPDDLHPHVREALAAPPASSALYVAPGRGAGSARPTARRSSPPAPPRASRCASTCPTLDVLCRDRARPGAVPVPDQGAGPGPGARAARVRAHAARAPGDLRRRHAARAARPQIRKRANVVLTNPDMLHVGILPNHRGLGRLLREPRRGRGRRGARLPRRVRLARRQRAAPPAPRWPRPTAPSRASCWPSATIANPVRAGRAR